MSAVLTGVVDVLTRAGVSSDEFAVWISRERRELGGRSPGDALAAGRADDVLKLARGDAADMAEVEA